MCIQAIVTMMENQWSWDLVFALQGLIGIGYNRVFEGGSREQSSTTWACNHQQRKSTRNTHNSTANPPFSLGKGEAISITQYTREIIIN